MTDTFPVPSSDNYPIKPLNISPSKFLEGYNLDIEPFVENLSFMSKGPNKVLYMSYSHAWRLFNMNFPNLGVTCETNPYTGGHVFEEKEGKGYFVKPYIYGTDPEYGCFRTASIYFPVLNSANAPIYPSSKDKNSNPSANPQAFNKAYMRAIVKAIAISTGIGLKLWTQDDLSEDFQDEKLDLLKAIQGFVNEYNSLSTQGKMSSDVTYMNTVEEIKTKGKEIKQALEKLKQNQVTQEVEVSVESKSKQ